MRKRGERVLGPYEQHNGWRVVEITAKGERSSSLFAREIEAAEYAAELRADLERDDHTTRSALAEYRKHLETKGNKPDSIRQTIWAIEQFFPADVPLVSLTPKKCQALYDAVRDRPLERTGEPPSVDTHRSMLAQSASFLEWCRVEKGWIREASPLDNVKGIGKRRPRGKSLGKSGAELRIRQTREWYGMALFKAERGDQGATAALVALLLGMRAGEIVSRKVGDLDDDLAAGDLLWIKCSKTPSGRRTLEVPGVLQPLLLAAAGDKTSARYLFEAELENGVSRPHWRDWILHNVHRICDAAEVPRITAHAMRGLLATLTAERGLAGHLIAATLGHSDERVTQDAYMRPGAAATGVNRAGLTLLNGGVQVRAKSAN
jgi:integrase